MAKQAFSELTHSGGRGGFKTCTAATVTFIIWHVGTFCFFLLVCACLSSLKFTMMPYVFSVAIITCDGQMHPSREFYTHESGVAYSAFAV